MHERNVTMERPGCNRAVSGTADVLQVCERGAVQGWRGRTYAIWLRVPLLERCRLGHGRRMRGKTLAGETV